MSEVTTLAATPPAPVFVSDGETITTSQFVADFFGKQHTHVLERIRTLECSERFRQSNFRSAEYLDAQGKPRISYRITRDGFTFLAMGFTGPRAAQFKEAFIAAFNAMEAQLHGGAALPELARSVSALVQRQDAIDSKVNAILDLVDVTKRYVGLLEANQKKPPRRNPYARVTSELIARVKEMAEQGYTVSAIALEVDLPRTTIYRIQAGDYSAAKLQRNDTEVH